MRTTIHTTAGRVRPYPWPEERREGRPSKYIDLLVTRVYPFRYGPRDPFQGGSAAAGKGFQPFSHWGRVDQTGRGRIHDRRSQGPRVFQQSRQKKATHCPCWNDLVTLPWPSPSTKAALSSHNIYWPGLDSCSPLPPGGDLLCPLWFGWMVICMSFKLSNDLHDFRWCPNNGLAFCSATVQYFKCILWWLNSLVHVFTYMCLYMFKGYTIIRQSHLVFRCSTENKICNDGSQGRQCKGISDNTANTSSTLGLHKKQVEYL